MNIRKLVISAIGVLFLIATFFLIKGGDKPANQQVNPSASNQIAVQTVVVKPDTHYQLIPITGRIVPKESIDLFAEVSGVAHYGNHPFKTGQAFSTGELLLAIDTREIEASIRSLRGQFIGTIGQLVPDLKFDYPDAFEAWRNYLNRISISATTPALPEISDAKLKLFLAGRQVYTNYYKLKELEERLTKFKIKAPYNGVLVETKLNRGTLVRVGQKLGVFQQKDSYELEASLPANQLEAIELGQGVQLTDINSGIAYSAVITRINGAVDPLSQMVKVYADIQGESLRSGYYLSGKIMGQAYPNSVKVPLSALVTENSVFVAKDKHAQTKAVIIKHKGNEQAIITGLEVGDHLILDSKNASFNETPIIETTAK